MLSDYLVLLVYPEEPEGQGLQRLQIHGEKLKSRKTRLLFKQPRFLYASLGICFTPLPLGQIE